MPTGIFTLMLRRFFTSPEPRQFLHGESIRTPFPLQVAQGVTWTYVAKPVFRMFWIFPAPLHRGHVRGEVPGLAPEPPHTSHFSVLGTSISFSVPLAASSSVISRSNPRSWPLLTCSVNPPPKPPLLPKKARNRSPTPKSLNTESKSAPRKISSLV